ncbi:MAG: hypothetical protein ACJA2W_002640 [Planctomycetota bacterium]|jgi:hypothetical protein
MGKGLMALGVVQPQPIGAMLEECTGQELRIRFTEPASKR